MIKAIFFDFYNTLGRFDPAREELQALACSDFGIDVTPEGITLGYAIADTYMSREVAKLPLRKRDSQGIKDFFAHYQQLILRGAGVEASLDMALNISVRLRELSYDFALYEDVTPTLNILKKENLKLGLISNNDGDIDKLCERVGLSPYLDFALNSEESGLPKPHPSIFLEALSKASVDPKEALHVGDQYESDVKGALGVGIHPVMLDRDGLKMAMQDCPIIRSLPELFNILQNMRGHISGD